jgi:hypothetical protein
VKPLFFCLALLGGSSLPALKASDPPNLSDLESLVELLEESEDGFVGLPFSAVVLATTGHHVRPVDPKLEAENLTTITQVIERSVNRINQGVHAFQQASRINEASGPIEEEILREFASEPAWKVCFAPTADGKIQRSGYPDLRLHAPDGRIYYLDPKLIQEGNRASSFRTFYYEPKKTTGKINDDAAHLLIGFAHNEQPGEARRIVSWDLIDLAELPIRLKAEFQASNREIYRPAATLHQSKITMDEQP